MYHYNKLILLSFVVLRVNEGAGGGGSSHLNDSTEKAPIRSKLANGLATLY
jgi:hypothetical protein